jgi:hypothetical protein
MGSNKKEVRMPSLIDYLRMFNRKERYWLLKWSLGGFEPGQSFRQLVRKELKLDVPTDPESTFLAMDYHLNWIYAALVLAREGKLGEPYENPMCEVDGSPSRVIEGNQEDVDLLLAFESEAKTQLVMFEAKLDSPWSSKQVRRKAERLQRIFTAADCLSTVQPHFVLVSPVEPLSVRQSIDQWFAWLSPVTVRHLPIQVDIERWDVTRCDSTGAQWMTRRVAG